MTTYNEVAKIITFETNETTFINYHYELNKQILKQ